MNPPIFLIIFKILIDKIGNLDIPIEQFPVMPEEDGLRLAEIFVPVFEDVMFYLVELGEELFVFCHEESG